MTEPVDKPSKYAMDWPFITIYEEDLEESAKDPRVKAFLEEAYENFKRMEAEGRIIYGPVGPRATRGGSGAVSAERATSQKQ